MVEVQARPEADSTANVSTGKRVPVPSILQQPPSVRCGEPEMILAATVAGDLRPAHAAGVRDGSTHNIVQQRRLLLEAMHARVADLAAAMRHHLCAQSLMC
jgi:hypothetical protein